MRWPTWSAVQPFAGATPRSNRTVWNRTCRSIPANARRSSATQIGAGYYQVCGTASEWVRRRHFQPLLERPRTARTGTLQRAPLNDGLVCRMSEEMKTELLGVVPDSVQALQNAIAELDNCFLQGFIGG